MRHVPLCAMVVFALGAGGAALAAGAPPMMPSARACVATWNASPGLREGTPARRAFVEVLPAGTGMFAWNRKAKVSFNGPGCAVWVVEPSHRVEVVFRSWSVRTTPTWRAPVAIGGLPSGDRPNATVGADGRLRLG
jgi:hypothetical protein